MQQLITRGIQWDEMLYINFEDERLTGMTAEHLNLLLEVHLEMYGKKPILFLDEIQNIAGKLVDKETVPKYYFTDNGLLNLFLLDGNTSLLENMVAINLLRKYGRNDAVYFYNQGIEVDFYVPDTSTAIQVCFDIDNSVGTFDREVKALLKITEVLECRQLLIITRDTERMLEIRGKKIEVIPVWKWLLNL